MSAGKQDIMFYCGVGEMNYNHHPVFTGPRACVSPVCGSTEQTKSVNRVRVPSDALVMQDSGAFSDGPGQRLSYAEALDRQIAHAERFVYTNQIEARASYDCLLIDEIWENGVRRKERWPEEAGEFAVKTSVDAARYISQHRYGLPLVLSAQGVSPKQYLKCAHQIVPMMGRDDIFGLGGWCIIGKLPKRMMPIFREAMQQVIPFLGSEGVKRVHIWGVCYAPALGELLWLCDQHGIQVSTDSVGPSVRPVMGSWGYSSWRDNSYQVPPVLDSCKQTDLWGNKAPSCAANTRCRGLERARSIKLTSEWLADFKAREAKHYRYVPIVEKQAMQLSLDIA